MSIRRPMESKAFGVEEGHPPYRLRQARYYELGLECATLASQHFAATGRNLELLDVVVWDGITRKYAETNHGGHNIDYHGVDIFPKGKDFVYKHEDWVLHHIDLEHGLTGLETARYDVVVGEQVLEHLHNPGRALSDMYRVLRPGGRIILGVPIFPPGLDLIRKYVVPVTDRLFKIKKIRGHVQGWSRNSFLRLVRQSCPGLMIESTRGFRIVSGGILRPLEYCKWWWQLNRQIGRRVPGLCIEVQVVAKKPVSRSNIERHSAPDPRLARISH